MYIRMYSLDLYNFLGHEEARLSKKWKLFSDRVTKLRDQMVKSTTTFAFRFVEVRQRASGK